MSREEGTSPETDRSAVRCGAVHCVFMNRLFFSFGFDDVVSFNNSQRARFRDNQLERIRKSHVLYFWRRQCLQYCTVPLLSGLERPYDTPSDVFSCASFMRQTLGDAWFSSLVLQRRERPRVNNLRHQGHK